VIDAADGRPTNLRRQSNAKVRQNDRGFEIRARIGAGTVPVGGSDLKRSARETVLSAVSFENEREAGGETELIEEVLPRRVLTGLPTSSSGRVAAD